VTAGCHRYCPGPSFSFRSALTFAVVHDEHGVAAVRSTQAVEQIHHLIKGHGIRFAAVTPTPAHPSRPGCQRSSSAVPCEEGILLGRADPAGKFGAI
jgi:hypothetical protein